MQVPAIEKIWEKLLATEARVTELEVKLAAAEAKQTKKDAPKRRKTKG